jgi:hypothetical protein
VQRKFTSQKKEKRNCIHFTGLKEARDKPEKGKRQVVSPMRELSYIR